MTTIKRVYVTYTIVFCLFCVFSIFGCAQNAVVKKPVGVSKAQTTNQTTKKEAASVQDETESDDQNEENSIFNIFSNNGSGQQKTDNDEKQNIMEEALELLEEADKLWAKGDVEETIDILDEAYSLILEADGDSLIDQEKDDLRLLISRRIMTVYSSRQITTNGKASEIQLLMNADVEKEIRSFQGIERDFFISSYQRSAMYKEIIVGELRKAGIPEELFWLPLVESGFKVSALSRARALGLWQFIPSTGYKFGLTRDEWVDERMDVLKSTQAAIAYLKELHAMFGDWLTVLAAYNCGEGRVLRVISRQHINYCDRFWDLYSQLPNETARYVPRFLATLHIIKNPGKYGFDLQAAVDTSLRYETVKVNKTMKLADVASKIEVPEDVINILNAELRYKTTPDREYELKIPKGSLQKFNLVYNDIPLAEKPNFSYVSRPVPVVYKQRPYDYIKHRVRPGESVASIAKKYRVSSQTIFNANKISKKKKLINQARFIRIPVTGAGSSNMAARKRAGSIQTYKVKRGDSLSGIARRFNVPVSVLKKKNHLKTNSVKIGQTLNIPS